MIPQRAQSRAKLVDVLETARRELLDLGLLDEQLVGREVVHVTDADSPQMLALLDVIDGRNMVIQGPPSTGKSQTIVNLIAAALDQGKKVLFVAEKMAALNVVKRRLDAAKLGAACLELHSNKTNKKTVIEELKRTAGGTTLPAPGTDGRIGALDVLRKRLNEYCKAVNEPIDNSGENSKYGFWQNSRRPGRTWI